MADSFFGKSAASSKGLNRPHGKTETVLDYLQRGEYASAGVAEFLKGMSPYDNIFEAAWKGLSGQRRMNYMELTGNIPLGLVMGIALDPVTWIPAGALGKMVKMTGIPKAVGLASLKMAERFPAYARLSGLVDSWRPSSRVAGSASSCTSKTTMRLWMS